MNRKISLTMIFLLGVVLQNCYYDNEQELYGETVCNDTDISYTGRISVIIQQRCLSCHSQAGAQGGIVLEGYNNLKSVASSGRLEGAVTHASGYAPMPKNAPQLGQCDLDAIVQWINAGALNN